jgi:hypothetical protein
MRRARALVVLAAVMAALAACPGDQGRQDAAAKPGRLVLEKLACAASRRAVSGRLTNHTRWCKTVDVVGNLLVPPGVTLVVDPGTRVRFKAYRGYKHPERRLQLRVEGTLLARGTRQRPIRFTSSAADARNGDWSMIKLVESRGSRVENTIVEFAQHGLNLWRTNITLDGVVLRFHNWEGLYLENRCKVKVRRSRIYANGYNCIAAEQFNDLDVRGSYIANCGSSGVLIDVSRAHLSRNLIEGSPEGVMLDNGARVTLRSNRFTGQIDAAVSCGQGNNRIEHAANVFDGVPERRRFVCADGVVEAREGDPSKAPRELRTGIVEGPAAYLDYIPGELPHDTYPYVYPDRDETRAVTHKIGGGLGLTWSLAWDGAALWTATLGGKLHRLDPVSGKVLQTFAAPGPQPWGMTFARQHLWVNDFAQRKIYKLDPKDGSVRHAFAAPDPAGGCKGLASDGKHLFALGWGTHRLYTLTWSGKVSSSVPVPAWDLGGGAKRWVAGGLTWDGASFWGPADRLIRFGPDGKMRGWIYATSERVWDLTWDGKALWTTQRANENWRAIPRLFRVELRAIKPAQKRR